MPLVSVTYCQQYKRANVHTYGCNFKCKGCSYKLNEERSQTKTLTLEQVKNALRSLKIKRVHFVGGEPTLCQDIGPIAKFCHEELCVRTKIGHSMGWNMPPNDIDEMNITIKAYSERIHKEYTGAPNKRVLTNFRKIYDQGITLSASTVFIPSLIDLGELEDIAIFIADVDPLIPLHITGYIPVPGTPWRSPNPNEMAKAKQIAKQHLEEVTTSYHQSADDYTRMIKEDSRYQSIRVA
ncbi:MAG: radical SAM protein [Methanocellales archaeon]|nr:radical SAM protein [Methanocellales archaeon]MDD3292024.1 radical SAM protein [Methanocellales archaeon]MDD5235693.1 radical SAM protein [Methanocellales archaeon]MDD5485619.1 radical SAM protein [Methanocellales archaeon]